MRVSLIGPDGKPILNIKAESTAEGFALGRLLGELHRVGVSVDSLVDDVDEVYLRIVLVKSPKDKEVTN